MSWDLILLSVEYKSQLETFKEPKYPLHGERKSQAITSLSEGSSLSLRDALIFSMAQSLMAQWVMSVPLKHPLFFGEGETGTGFHERFGFKQEPGTPGYPYFNCLGSTLSASSLRAACKQHRMGNVARCLKRSHTVGKIL